MLACHFVHALLNLDWHWYRFSCRSHICRHGLVSSRPWPPLATVADLNTTPSNPPPPNMQLLSILENRWLLSFQAALTIWVVFGDDLKLAILPPEADIVVESLIIISLGFFLLEITASSLARPRFFLSFYFWLDLFATLSLFLEFPMIRRTVLGQGISYYDIEEEANAGTLTGARLMPRDICALCDVVAVAVHVDVSCIASRSTAECSVIVHKRCYAAMLQCPLYSP